MAGTQKLIRFKFSRASDYRTITANGAWGGLATNGVIAVDLYVERTATPESAVRHIVGERAGEEEILPDSSEILVNRESQVGLLMTPEAARAIGKFLLDQAEQYDRLYEPTPDDRESKDARDTS
jgi:hypothetical protein